jgi:hypothetical protein
LKPFSVERPSTKRDLTIGSELVETCGESGVRTPEYFCISEPLGFDFTHFQTQRFDIRMFHPIDKDKTLFNHVILPSCLLYISDRRDLHWGGGGGGNMETVEITYALGDNMGTGEELTPPV